MKKTILLSAGLLSILLTGCSIDTGANDSKLEEITTKAEDFASKAEAMGDKVDETKRELEKLIKQEELSSQDQEDIENEIDKMLSTFAEFKKEEAPFLTKTAKKIVINKMEEIEEVLLEVKDKAERGEVTRDDLEKIDDILSGNIEFMLFN